MKKVSKMQFILCVLIILCSACKKSETNSQNLTNNTPIAPVVTPPPVQTGPVYSKTYEVGTGTGDLTINGSSYTLGGDVLFKIKGGSYKSIKISNIDGGTGSVTIQNNGLIEMVGSVMVLENLNKVTISGAGTTGIDKGFSFRDNSYRAIETYGKINNFTIKYVAFKNIGDKDFALNYDAVYDGTENSYLHDLHFLNISCDNSNQFLTTGGYIGNGQVYGLVKNLEIGYVDYKNSPGVGTIVYLGNVEAYDIHNNTVSNINTSNNNHNGIFHVSGNGKFYSNLVSNHQGNAIRAWGHTVGTTPKEILIYNNIIVNSRKYGGFEVQGFADRMLSGKTTFTNAKVFNNTCGNLNSLNDWQASVVDVYSLMGGKCEVFNNLEFNSPTAKKSIALQWSDLLPNSYNNLYFETADLAGILNQTDFKLSSSSPAKGTGIATTLSLKDFYGLARANPPSIGAVE